MRTFGEAIDQLVGAEASGFDVARTQAARLLQQGVERFASRSEWIKSERDFGPTVAGQEEYELASEIVKVKGLAVAGTPYVAVDVLTIWQYKIHGLPRRVDGAYAERFNDDGKIRALGLLPIPDVDGMSIEGLAVLLPNQLEEADELPFPADYRRGPLEYAKGIAYEELDENPEAGAVYLERARGLADELRELSHSRTGSGPAQAPVATARRR